ncbi:DUF317 domain-containing protein [Streptomyces hirsutus]|uniref:DUF317 domain-containing protein n=1 Tax=Streptomyces hirsutus TaxID=35620 RepID=UPI0006E3032E|nr:DUF317 domain-containing protein [Streptomyces hirsutus]
MQRRVFASCGQEAFFEGPWMRVVIVAALTTAYASPCSSVFLDFTPDRQDGVWWTIAHHEPYWQIEFSRQTPSEAIASVIQALPQLLGDPRHFDRIPLATESVTHLAKTSGWEGKATTAGMTWTSPDGHCTVEHSTDPVHPWQIEHSVCDGFDKHWTATFTPEAPERLVAQLFTHLATNTPVEHAFRDVPNLVQNLNGALITPVRGAAVNPHAHHVGAPISRTVRRR